MLLPICSQLISFCQGRQVTCVRQQLDLFWFFFFLILTFFLNEFDLKSRREMILPEAGVCECVSILNQGNRLLCMPPSSPAVA